MVLAKKQDQPQIFLSYAHSDLAKSKSLYIRLQSVGFKPWMDSVDILPGEEWQLSVKNAIQHSDFFIACLSANSISRRGEIQREIKSAMEQWGGMLRNDIYFIPVRLEEFDESAIPEELGKFQWVDLFKSDGFEKLVRAIRVGMERRGLTTPDKSTKTFSEDGYIVTDEKSLNPPLQEFDPHFLDELEAPGGAVKLRDKFYIERDADTHLKREITQVGTTITIRAPRQTGKTSLLVRGVQHAKQNGARVIHVDLQNFAFLTDLLRFQRYGLTVALPSRPTHS